MLEPDYKKAVKQLIITIYDHEMHNLPNDSDLDRMVTNWSNYLLNILSVPKEDLLFYYQKALDYRNENKISAKFRLQDIQAVVNQYGLDRKNREISPVVKCALCGGTGKITVFDITQGKDVLKVCKH